MGPGPMGPASWALDMGLWAPFMGVCRPYDSLVQPYCDALCTCGVRLVSGRMNMYPVGNAAHLLGAAVVLCQGNGIFRPRDLNTL